MVIARTKTVGSVVNVITWLVRVVASAPGPGNDGKNDKKKPFPLLRLCRRTFEWESRR